MAASTDKTPGVASAKSNDKLDHSEGGVTTRRDALDSGVPMLAGDPSEPVGPEDALGKGPKRGDYSEVVGNRQHYHSVVNPDHDPEDESSPRFILEHQNPNVDNVGEVKGRKGGVETDDQ